jgi:hypothetical protein
VPSPYRLPKVPSPSMLFGVPTGVTPWSGKFKRHHIWSPRRDWGCSQTVANVAQDMGSELQPLSSVTRQLPPTVPPLRRLNYNCVASTKQNIRRRYTFSRDSVVPLRNQIGEGIRRDLDPILFTRRLQAEANFSSTQNHNVFYQNHQNLGSVTFTAPLRTQN